MQKKKGISLIVLVITIVVMIIIAGTTISVMVGENSIINQAKKAKVESDLAQLKESSELVKSTGLTEYYSGDKTKYDKEDLLNDLNNNFEGSLLSTNKITTADGQYDIIVDDDLNVTVRSRGQGSLTATPKVVATDGTTFVSLRFSVPGETTVVDYLLNYIDTKLYKEKSIAEMETEFVTLTTEPAEDGTIPAMTDAAREEINLYGQMLGASTYEQALKAMLLVVSMQTSENQYETFGILGEIAYPYATKYIGLKEYTNKDDLKNQLVSVTGADSFETYLSTEFDGATEADLITTLEENNAEYEDFLRFLILQEYVSGLTEEEQAELLEPYMMEIKVSNGTTTETIPYISLLGVYPYQVSESGVYTFELTTMDGTTTSVETNVKIEGELEGAVITPVEGSSVEAIKAGNPMVGDTIEYNGYIYKYNQICYMGRDEWMNISDTFTFEETADVNSWGVRVQDTGLETYPDMESTIYSIPVEYVTFTFYECSNMVTAPKISDETLFLYGAFWGCSLLNDVNIPDKTTSLSFAFYNCSSLQGLTLPSGIKDVANTFQNCTSMATTPLLPEGVTQMWATFAGCTALTRVQNIPESVTSLDCAFKDCTSLTNVPAIPAAVKDLDSAFENCTSLEGTITINSTLVTSYTKCFAGTTKPIILAKTSCSVLSEIAATATGGNVTVAE